MRVVLMDLDLSKRRRPFPNLALMKLSAWHKAQGNEVFLNFPLAGADVTYASCVFSWHRKRLSEVPPGASVGGIGLGSKRQLPDEVEHMMPDYDLYANNNFSMGFTSRGCIRDCPPCKVPDNEGKIRDWSSINEFWDRRHNKIVLLDNNLLAAPSCLATLADLANQPVEVDFNQGLDIRLINDELAWYLKQIKTRKLRFAFDSLSYERNVREGVKILTKAGFASRHLSFYVLTGYEAEDYVVERMKILASLNVDVYPMVYRDDSGKESERRLLYSGDIFWHGNRRNINKFLRIVGRLPA